MAIRILLALALVAVVGPSKLIAQSAEDELDVPYVPTPRPVVDEMLRIAKVGEEDVVYDLGSGDGRIVIAAAEQFGARAVGIDIDPERIAEGRANAEAAGVEDRVRFIRQNLFQADITEASVVTLYLLSTINDQLRPKLLEELRPGARVVSHDFGMGEWEPQETAYVIGSSIYLWVIPARAGGRWSGTLTGADGKQSLSFTLDQTFQKLTGTGMLNGDYLLLGDAEVDGYRVNLEVTDRTGTSRRLQGTVDGDRIIGEVLAAPDGQTIGKWEVTRHALAGSEPPALPRSARSTE